MRPLFVPASGEWINDTALPCDIFVVPVSEKNSNYWIKDLWERCLMILDLYCEELFRSRELMSGGGLSLLASVSSRKVCARNNKFSGPSDVFSDLWKILLAIGGEHFLFTMKVPSWRTLLFLLIVVINVSFCQSDATNNSSEWVVFSFNLKKLPVPNCVYTGQLFLSSF